MAQCIEVNIAVSAEQQPDLLRLLTKRMQGQILLDTRRGIEPLSRLGPANPRYSAMLERATPLKSVLVPRTFKARLLGLLRGFEWPARRLNLAAVSV